MSKNGLASSNGLRFTAFQSLNRDFGLLSTPLLIFFSHPKKLFLIQTLIFGGNIELQFFGISEYLNIFDVPTLRNGHLKPKIAILGGQR